MLAKSLLLLSAAVFGALAAPAQDAELDKRAITCLRVGATATARWTNSAGQTCTFTGVVGSNYGANSAGSGE
jgi:hypothetical protein